MNLEKYGTVRKEYIGISERELKAYTVYDKHLEGVGKESKVLEIGPGNGGFSYYIKQKFDIDNKNISLVDLSDSIVSALKEQEKTKKFNVYLDDTINFLKTESEAKYDLILMRHIMEHFTKEYIIELIPLLLKKLNKGGKIIIEVPNFGNFPYGMYNCFADFTHVTYFTHETLMEAFLFNNVNDENIEVVPHNIINKFNVGGGILTFIKQVIGRIWYFISIIISFLMYRINGDKYGFGQVYTKDLLVVIEKK